MAALEVAGLSVRYGRTIAVDDVGFDVEAGEIVAMVGPNGAGKSSTLLGCYGSVRASGSVRLDGDEVGHLPALARARRGLSIVPQGRQLFPRLTVRENLVVFADVLRLPRSVVDEGLDRFPVLRERANRYTGVLSGGEQQMLAVSRALLAQPKVLLLDEIATGLAPMIVRSLVATVAELSAAGTAVLLAEPALGMFTGSVGRGMVLQRGGIVATAEDGEALVQQYQRAMGIGERGPDVEVS